MKKISIFMDILLDPDFDGLESLGLRLIGQSQYTTSPPRRYLCCIRFIKLRCYVASFRSMLLRREGRSCLFVALIPKLTDNFRTDVPSTKLFCFSRRRIGSLNVDPTLINSQEEASKPRDKLQLTRRLRISGHLQRVDGRLTSGTPALVNDSCPQILGTRSGTTDHLE